MVEEKFLFEEGDDTGTDLDTELETDDLGDDVLVGDELVEGDAEEGFPNESEELGTDDVEDGE